MKSIVLQLVITILLLSEVSAQVIYVREGGNGDGSTWGKALGDLQNALAAAEPGSEIWVAEGTYFPIKCDHCNVQEREIPFKIPSGVKLYGGFSGTENSLGQRKWYAHPTKLSGEIGTEDDSDNSFNVVLLKNTGEGTLIDGFVITGGKADAWGQAGSRNRSGGGLFNDGAGRGNRSLATLKNCVFLENYAEEGGAVFNHGQEGEASLKMENCTFVSNKAGKGGGAIFSNNDLGLGKIELKKCKFVKNEAGFGAAVFITQREGFGKNQIISTHFVGNKAIAGSVFFSLALEEHYQPDFFLCAYLNNESKEGDEVFLCPENSVPKRLLNALAVNVSTKI
ncbi:MAG: hypothetical protein HY842_03500 [Bacteroidetes bacterium]|nr:hypothetical protein [Bacteroidota bacterium]